MKGKCLFKYTNVIEETVGNEGVSSTDIENIMDKINKSYNGLLEKYKNKELGFMDLVHQDLRPYTMLKKYSKDFEYIIIIGMGGSVLGAQMVYEGVKGIYYNERKTSKKVYFLDNSDPEKTFEILNLVDLEKTLVFAISKSGNTAETLANFLIVRDRLIDKVGNCNKNIIVVANGGMLRDIAEKEGYMLFDIPENVGGRFSVLSAVGLAPLSCMGINIEMLVKGAREMDELCKNEDIFKNPALMNAVIHYILYNKGKTISVLMPYIERLHKFGMWYRQLWAESLGKDGKGQTPIVSVGAKDQHSQLQLYLDGPRDKVITFLKVDEFRHDLTIKSSNYLNAHKLSELINSEQEGTEASLTSKNIPNVSIIIDELNEYTLGKLIYMYEMQTAFMGELLEINAFNQPSVEDGKRITRELLRGKSLEELTGFKSFDSKYVIEM
ncbi:glucose-6-phosphate isomerase [Methanothermococcus sp. Ax23]|uniref:glucose-6-phosphate isomerase n=1 Tax=Methanothermococcus sp. Ax23 TaxID=3156486 RepID=UPI003BA19B5D